MELLVSYGVPFLDLTRLIQQWSSEGGGGGMTRSTRLKDGKMSTEHRMLGRIGLSGEY